MMGGDYNWSDIGYPDGGWRNNQYIESLMKNIILLFWWGMMGGDNWTELRSADELEQGLIWLGGR